VRDPDPARAAIRGGGDQDVAVRGHGRLYDGEAAPRMLPELLAVGRDVRRARCAHPQEPQRNPLPPSIGLG